MVKIVQKEDRVLREVAQPVPEAEITSPKIKKILKDMSASLATCDDGVALAAPQIGVGLRIFIVSGKVMTDPESKQQIPDLIFINPEITKASKRKAEMEEGCLSVRWLYGKTKRSTNVTVEAFDENGKHFSWSGSGLMAQIFQHEIDHLNGILFIDHAKDLRDIPPEKQK